MWSFQELADVFPVLERGAGRERFILETGMSHHRARRILQLYKSGRLKREDGGFRCGDEFVPPSGEPQLDKQKHARENVPEFQQAAVEAQIAELTKTVESLRTQLRPAVSSNFEEENPPRSLGSGRGQVRKDH